MSIHHRQTVSLSAVALAALFFVAFLTIASPAAQAQNYSILHTFTGATDGGMPYAGLTMDAAGNFYGATYRGGTENFGVVYKLRRAGSGWVQDTLYAFTAGEDGAAAYGAVTIGPDGALYGTTYGGGGGICFGGCGIVYRLTPPATVCKAVSCPWKETVIYRFGQTQGDGRMPLYGAPVFDRAGNLYGTTSYGGAHDSGTVYELTRSGSGWTETILWNFDGPSGDMPLNGLIFDAAGNLYGTTKLGGANYSGNVFELSPSGSGWSETTLFNFPGSTGGPVSGLAWDAQGNLYGTTQGGGLYNDGTVFQLTPSAGTWNYTQLTYFQCCGGPGSTPTLDSAGNVYVSTVGTGGDAEGVVLKLTQSQGTWASTVLHTFEFTDGASPFAGVTLDANGNIYGTAALGGSDSQGVIFEITP